MIVKFGDVVLDTKGKVDRSNNPYDYYIAGDHMDTEDLELHRKGCFATDDVGPAFVRTFKPGQVLYGSRRTYLKKVAVADFEGVTANTTFVFETKDPAVLSQELLPFILLSDKFTEFSILKSRGSTNPYVLFSDLAEFEFNLPDIQKQEELAEILWSMEYTKRAYRKMIAQTDELVKSQFIEMFGTLEDNTNNYPVGKLGDIAAYWNGLTYKPADTTQDGSGILVLRSSNIQNGELAFEDNVRVNCPIKEKLFVKENDILMCSRNGSAALVGKAALIKNISEPMTFGAFMMIIRSDYYSFLKTFFEMPAFRNQISTGTSTINQITGNMLQQIIIPIPDMYTVNEFETFVKQSDKSKFELQKALDELTAMQKKIIMNAFCEK